MKNGAFFFLRKQFTQTMMNKYQEILQWLSPGNLYFLLLLLRPSELNY